MTTIDCIDTNPDIRAAYPALSWGDWLAIGANKLGADLVRLADTLSVWQERARQRAMLARLDDRMLQDIGAGRDMVCRELSKPVWRA